MYAQGFTDTERLFMTAIDDLVGVGASVEKDARFGEEYVSFLPGKQLSRCSRAVIGFATRPIGGTDLGLDAISIYNVRALEPINSTAVFAHLFHLREGSVWHRIDRRTPGERIPTDFSDHIELSEQAGEQAAAWREIAGRSSTLQESRDFLDVDWQTAVQRENYGTPMRSADCDELVAWLGDAMPNFIKLG